MVPNAYTSKEIFVCGSLATTGIDFESEFMTIHHVHQEFLNGTWTPVNAGSTTPNTDTATPVQMIQAEFKDFLDCAKNNRRPSANVVCSGIVLARVMEAIYESAKTNLPVSMDWSELELGGFNR